jgi:hypothetical protein
VNVTKAKLESLFGDELARLQPSPGYMRLLREVSWNRMTSWLQDLEQLRRTA